MERILAHIQSREVLRRSNILAPALRLHKANGAECAGGEALL